MTLGAIADMIRQGTARTRIFRNETNTGQRTTLIRTQRAEQKTALGEVDELTIASIQSIEHALTRATPGPQDEHDDQPRQCRVAFDVDEHVCQRFEQCNVHHLIIPTHPVSDRRIHLSHAARIPLQEHCG